ncbi:uncharacterized protein TRAVEDRAFT_74791 [Trametes versicolor FP-101664 SS1]|uniref:uncharacterized protein n=1 Tax=Trametes versicolor (strain FP-101664) TaxID=717944 RepID=UPI0004621523|nr:uncharacterized protein TRAVEDRAFT_74791 [Trametes versicolor FP-101664 SS1]EIW53483.1 hypothetical protein TRAVEDRAFT_74791 [Trametes versicolor FP-101664 SS1]
MPTDTTTSEDLDITVHHFTREHAEERSLSDQVLLDNAAALVTCLRNDAVWHTPRVIDFSVFSLTGKGVQYAVEPPPIYERGSGLKLGCTRAREREWGEPVHPDEDNAVSELDEFYHGLLRGLLAAAARAVPEPPATATIETPPDVLTTQDDQVRARPDKRKTYSERSVSQVSAKRPRFDEGSLFDALPLPHFEACLMTFENPWPPVQQAEFYPSTPTPIAPHTQATIDEHIADEFARLAWVIPVRGYLPWEGATPASMLADYPDDGAPDPQVPKPEAAYQNPDSPSIVWTRDALRAFWQFLQELRDADNLGPLGLAFYHLPVPHSAPSSMDPAAHLGSHKVDSTSWLGSPSMPDDGASEALEAPRSTLCQMDYVKVYHDARYTKFLRKVFNAWAYRRPGVKVRMLKGATLALLDECEKGLLLC